MKSFKVKLENKETAVHIAEKPVFESLLNKSSNILVVTDQTMSRDRIVKELIATGVKHVVLEAGEQYKNLESIESIAAAAVENGLDRSSLIVGIGGGVICDMAAFAAAVYMRGCRLVLVPTTLLSMVDASIGGKSGVDFLARKNLIGSFYPAEDVLVFTEFLNTLSDAEYKSGLAEIIKHAFLSGEHLLSFLERNNRGIMDREPGVMAELIYMSLRVKASYIEEDFREEGIRAHLNLGHTFGHALETAAGLGSFTHGEAVAWGIARAIRAGLLTDSTDKQYAERAENLLRDYGYNIDYSDFDRELYMNALLSDKKKRDGRLRFILQKDLGHTFITQLDQAVIEEVLN